MLSRLDISLRGYDLRLRGWAWEDLNLRPLPYQGNSGSGWMMPDAAGYGVYLHTLLLSVA